MASGEQTFWVYPVYRNGRYQDQAGGYHHEADARDTARRAASYGFFCRVEVVARPRSADRSGTMYQVDRMGRRITERNGRVVACYYPGDAGKPRDVIGEIR